MFSARWPLLGTERAIRMKKGSCMHRSDDLGEDLRRTAIRQRRVAELKEQVAQGRYRVSAHQLAEKIMQVLLQGSRVAD